MSRWPSRRSAGGVEPPAWVRVFVVEDWRDPAEEAAWAEKCPWVALHLPERLEERARNLARGRWLRACGDWYREHPGCDTRLEDLIARSQARRARRGNGVS